MNSTTEVTLICPRCGSVLRAIAAGILRCSACAYQQVDVAPLVSEAAKRRKRGFIGFHGGRQP